MEPFSHLAYAIAAMSFALRDVFYLRCVAIVSSSTMVAAQFLQPSRSTAAVFWHTLFVMIHCWRVATIVYGERRAHFTAEESELLQTLFRGFTKLEFMKLLRAGRWGTAEPGSVLTRQGERVQELVLISHGVAEVEAGGRWIAELRDGQLVGDLSFVTGNPATATVTVRQPTRYLAWSQERLREMLGHNPAMRFAMANVMSGELTRKLMNTSGSRAAQ